MQICHNLKTIFASHIYKNDNNFTIQGSLSFLNLLLKPLATNTLFKIFKSKLDTFFIDLTKLHKKVCLCLVRQKLKQISSSMLLDHSFLKKIDLL